VRRPEEREHLEDLSLSVRTILKCILKEEFEVAWTGLT
jgi:hypothetical protein